MFDTPLSFVYCSFDKNSVFPSYAYEAIISGLSVRRAVPNATIKVYTDRPEIFDQILSKVPATIARVFDFVFTIPSPEDHKAAKIQAILDETSSKFVFLDTHTIVAKDFSGIFDYSNFAIAGARATNRQRTCGIVCSGEREYLASRTLNTGVLFINKDRAEKNLQSWLKEYRALQKTMPLAMDQTAFARSIARDETCTLLELPNNYNFRLNQGGYLSGDLFCLHTHYRRTLREIMKDGPNYDSIFGLLESVASFNLLKSEIVLRKFVSGEECLDQYALHLTADDCRQAEVK